MINSTQVTFFTLSAYVDTGIFKYFYFLIVLAVYIATLSANVLIIVVICITRSLHEPMYLFLLSLFANELTGLFPFLLVQILSDVHTVSYSICLLQVFCLYSYGGIELLTLAIMSYDRYLAICYPLQYNTRMTFNKIVTLTALIWIYPLFINAVITYGLTGSLQLWWQLLHKPDQHKILYTYMRILKVCFSGSKQTRQKAFSTCTPHLASLLNFSCGAFFEIVQGRFNMTGLPNLLRVVLSLYWLTCQPLISPLMYGLKLSKIRTVCKTLLFGRKM
uniref:G-protein coupled receptors family 1 profile domain-containing protein n=1 Tax=Acanthochromis polyacanthus TaxID=80966 RepID=A0A3Q1G1W9_9TELE